MSFVFTKALTGFWVKHLLSWPLPKTTVALCHCLLTMVVVTHCSSKAKTFQGNVITREVSHSRGLEGSRSAPHPPPPSGILLQLKKGKDKFGLLLSWGTNAPQGGHRYFNQDEAFIWIRGMRAQYWFICLFCQTWWLRGQELDLFPGPCLLLSVKLGTKDTSDETWMQCPPLSLLFSGSSLCPFFGVSPRLLQVSPKSLCPYVSFSSWKRKLILKVALLFVPLVIPNWVGPICCTLGWSSHSMFLWYVTFPLGLTVAWYGGKNQTTQGC